MGPKPPGGGNPRHPVPRPPPDWTRPRAGPRDPAGGARFRASVGAIRRGLGRERGLPLARVGGAGQARKTTVPVEWARRPIRNADQAAARVRKRAAFARTASDLLPVVNQHRIGTPPPIPHKQLIQGHKTTAWQGPNRRRSGPKLPENSAYKSKAYFRYGRGPRFGADLHADLEILSSRRQVSTSGRASDAESASRAARAEPGGVAHYRLKIPARFVLQSGDRHRRRCRRAPSPSAARSRSRARPASCRRQESTIAASR
jgi:hypothetical protein